MKHYFLPILLGLLLFSSCGSDNEDASPKPPVVNPDNKPSAGSEAQNCNPQWTPELARLEMPHLHQGQNDTVLIHKDKLGEVNYITEWDYKRKTQRWSCYVLNSSFLEAHAQRYDTSVNGYPNDELISATMQWEEDPYYGNNSRYEHGHICPSADRLSSSTVNFQTFYLTNMQPQFKDFNGGLWARLENQVRVIARKAAQQGGTLYICKGGTVDEGMWGGFSKIYHTQPNGLIVPRYFYMALLREVNGQYTAMAFWTDQISETSYSGTDYSRFAISIDELEKRTGIDFFCNLPGATETTVEATTTNML